MSEVKLSTGDALAIRRLLWDLASSAEVAHDLTVEAYHWAAVLDDLAGMPSWPTSGEAKEATIAFYEAVAARLNEHIRHLRGGSESNGDITAPR